MSAPPPPNPALTRFYLRAKETFLTPIGPYSLPVPLDVLAPYYSTSDVPGARTADYTLGIPGQLSHPPCPEVFDELEERVRAMLSESLDRFVVATFHNVGMPRAYCGCAGGTVIGLTGRCARSLLRLSHIGSQFAAGHVSGRYVDLFAALGACLSGAHTAGGFVLIRQSSCLLWKLVTLPSFFSLPGSSPAFFLGCQRRLSSKQLCWCWNVNGIILVSMTDAVSTVCLYSSPIFLLEARAGGASLHCLVSGSG